MEETVNTFKSRRVPVYKPGEEEYERSVATANLLYRFSRPSCVVQPEFIHDVQIIVTVAKLHKKRITIKNGGHSYAGFSSTNEDILLDLSKMNKVKLDMESKTVTLQGGALWGHAYKQLINGRHDGYIINGGRCPTVGVSGYVLGGGLSPFTRRFGMGCDTLEEATIVTADANEVTVKKSDHRETNEGKLFWALCGAGGGNFGIVVELKMGVQELQNKDVVAGRYTWFPKLEPEDFMTTMNEFYTTNWPSEITIDSTWLCDLRQKESDPVVRFIVYYDGNKDAFDNLINESVRQEELARQLKRRSLPEKSTRFLHETLVSQWSEETKKSFPSNRSYSIYTSFVIKNDEDRIRGITSTIREVMKDFRKQFTGEQGLLQVTFIHSGGHANEEEPSATAFPWRDCAYIAYIMIQWDEKWLEADMRDFLKNFKSNLGLDPMEGWASFINFPDKSLHSNAHERAYYGDNHQKLRRIKYIWDKDNFFNWAQGVQLPRGGGGGVASVAAGGEFSRKESVVDEEDLTDIIAGQQWENHNLPPTNDFVGIQGFPYLGF